MQIAQFGVLDITSSLFTAEFNFNANTVLKFVLDDWSDKLNGKTTAIPLPANAPIEIPRVTMEGNNNGYKITASPVRLDVCWNALNQQGPIDLATFFQWTNDVFSKYKQSMNCRVVRLAGVVHRFSPTSSSEEAAQQLTEHFCPDRCSRDPFDRAKEFELHELKQLNMFGFSVNSWVRFKTPTLNIVSPNGQNKLTGIFIEQDINTLAEEMPSSNYSAGDIGKFFSVLPNQCMQILERFFPAN